LKAAIEEIRMMLPPSRMRGKRLLNSEQQAAGVDTERFVEMARRDLFELLMLDKAGTRNQDVDLAFLLANLGVKSI
jgi:hypothetical protein